MTGAANPPPLGHVLDPPLIIHKKLKLKIIQDLQRPEAPDLGQVQQCGGVKHVFDISTLPYISRQCRKSTHTPLYAQ